MDRRLFDTSTVFDVQRAPKHLRAAWAWATLGRFRAYEAHHPRLTISGPTVFEYLEGLYRDGRADAANDFRDRLQSAYDVIYPDEAILVLGAEINAALARGQTIGLADALVAATALDRGLTLVTGNAGHFARVQAAGFPLRVENWREA